MNPNWNQIVREHLAVLRLPPEREIEIVEELALHLEAAYEDALDAGLSEVEAEERAVQGYDWRLLECELSRAELPATARTLKPSLELIERTGGLGMESLLQDLRFGVRMLVKQPGLTLIAVLTLALGIGANTAIFSVIYNLYWAPAEWPNYERSVVVWTTSGGGRNNVSPREYLEWKRQATSFETLRAASQIAFNLSDPSAEPQHIQGQALTPEFLTQIGEKLQLGRDFAPEEGQPGKNRVVILSNRIWQERFGANRQIIGESVLMDGQTYVVIGVRPPGSADRRIEQLWVPLVIRPEEPSFENRYLTILGHLKPGVDVEQAQAEMNAIASRLAEANPQTNKGIGALVQKARNNWLNPRTRQDLWMLMGAVALVLLIACVNVANLLLARGVARQKELAVRAALGATTGQLFRQLLTESLALAVFGGAFGVGLSWSILKIFLTLMPQYSLPPTVDPKLSYPVLLFTLATTLLAGLIFGCLPAWQAARPDLNDCLKQGDRAGVARGRQRLGRALVVVEFALALTLLAGAGLAMRSLWNRAGVDLGVRTDRILTFQLPVRPSRFANAEQITTFYRGVMEKIAALPGVERVAAVTGMPISELGQMAFRVAGQQDTSAPSQRSRARLVTPGFLDTFGVRLKQGRNFTEQDQANSPLVAMVNEKFAALHLAGLDPLTQSLLIPGSRTGAVETWQIVGVFQDIQNAPQFGDPNLPEICIPFAQHPLSFTTLAVRTATEPEHLSKAIAAVIHTIDPDLPMARLRTMEQVTRERLAFDRFEALVYSSFAGLALLLATVGIYGVMAFAVTERTHEIGVRMALGASRELIFWLILKESATLALIGLGLGLVGAYLVGQTMKGTLYGTGAVDLPAICAVAFVLLCAALLACWIPARRATKVDPLIALRHE